MKDEELLEWYANNNTKPADMSEKEYELNKNKAIKLKQDKALSDNYNSQVSSLQTAQRNAEQNASISNDKLMKYLGQAQLSSGVAKGQTSSDFIKANNSYMANRAQITGDYADKQAELLDSYNLNKLDNEVNSYNNEIAILDKYRQREIEDKQLAREEELFNTSQKKAELEMQAAKLGIDSAKQQMDWDTEDRDWELKNRDWVTEDRETGLKDKEQVKLDTEDEYWLNAAYDKLRGMYNSLIDNNGNIDSGDRQKLLVELNKYKDKFNSEEYYNKLLDLYDAIPYIY